MREDPEISSVRSHVLILGWSGFIGSSLRAHLEQQGLSVFGLGRSSSLSSASSIDTADPKWLLRILDTHRVSIVVNSIGNVSKSTSRAIDSQSWEEIRKGFEEAIDGLMGLKRVIHFGSAAEYGSAPIPFSEHALASPTTDYGRAKLKETQFISSLSNHGVRTIVVRPSNVIGANMRGGMLIPSALRAISGGEKLQVVKPYAVRNYVYISDLIRAVIRIILDEGSLPQILNLGSSNNFSNYATLGKLASALSLPLESFVTGLDSEIAPEGVDSSPDTLTIDSDLARIVLGWEHETSMESAFLKIGRDLGLID